MIVGMVKPRRSRAAVTPVQTGLTLAVLTQRTDALIGRPSGLDEQLIRYRCGRDTVTALRTPERTAVVARACLAALMRGVQSDGRWRIARVDVPDRMARRLTSEAVRRCQPELWAASRVPGYRLAVSSATLSPPRVPVVRAATVGQLIDTMRQDGSRAVAATEAADTARTELIGVYQAIEDARPWGGDLLATTDGWMIGYTPTVTFSRSVCRMLADDQGIDVEPMMTEQLMPGGVRWRVIDAAAVADSSGDAYGDPYAP